MHLILTFTGLVIGTVMSGCPAKNKNTVDPEVRQQIEAVLAKQDKAYNKSDAAGCTTDYTLIFA